MNFESAYSQLFYDGENNDFATDIGNYHTAIHSTKIKSGNQLEKFIFGDFKNNSEANFYNKAKGKTVQNLSQMGPCLINPYRFSKEFYEKHGEICKNKTAVEVDFIFVDGAQKITLIEVKSGCAFDTKKSKGEIQSLNATSNALTKTGYFSGVSTCIVCFDAISADDVSLKTEMGEVQIKMFEEFSSMVGVSNGSRQRINLKKQQEAKKNIEFVKKFCKMMVDKYP